MIKVASLSTVQSGVLKPNLSPIIAIATALSTFIAIPVARDAELTFFGFEVDGFLVAPDLNIGILYIFAIASLSVYSLVLAGWSSDNKFALFGGLRASRIAS